ncbi:MAG TPA: hypothetical protein VEK33_07545 [Terriglobales bacterium]|nr:hypothetical protein [Terriglobales bacterium]
MRMVEVVSERSRKVWFEPEAERLRIVLADGSARSLDTVVAVLEFDEIVALVGRAQNLEQTIELVVSLRPDLVLMDIAMPSANLAIEAILVSATETKIVGMAADSIPLEAPSLILSCSALIHKSRLREEFLPALHALDGALLAFAPRLCLARPSPASRRGPHAFRHTRSQRF